MTLSRILACATRRIELSSTDMEKAEGREGLQGKGQIRS